MIERLAALSAREHALCAAVVLVLCGYVFYAGLLEPHLLELRTTSAKLRTGRILLAEKRRLASEQLVGAEKLKRLRQQLERSDATFLSPDGQSTFFAGLHTLAESNNCQLTAIDFLGDEVVEETREENEKAETSAKIPQEDVIKRNEEAGQPAKLMKSTARFSLTGTYPNVIRLLEAISEGPQLVDVSEITLELISKDTSDLNVSFAVSVFSLEKEGI